MLVHALIFIYLFENMAPPALKCVEKDVLN